MTEGAQAELIEKARRRLPSWGIILIAVVLVGAGVVWAGGMYDVKGNSYLSAGTVQILIALIGAVGTMFAVLLNRQSEQRDHLRETNRRIEHEFKPNHGSSLRDLNDRIEEKLTTVLQQQDTVLAQQATVLAQQATIGNDIGGIREEIRIDRRANASRFEKHDDRLHDLEHPKETS